MTVLAAGDIDLLPRRDHGRLERVFYFDSAGNHGDSKPRTLLRNKVGAPDSDRGSGCIELKGRGSRFADGTGHAAQQALHQAEYGGRFGRSTIAEHVNSHSGSRADGHPGAVLEANDNFTIAGFQQVANRHVLTRLGYPRSRSDRPHRGVAL
jgi:hypothetical protein